MTKSLLETDIFNYKTPEFYINMKSIPDKTSKERKSFVLEEKRKGIEGININGIHIPGGLYFHLNYYHLEGDDPLTGKKKVMLPRLRDNEWIFFNDYEKCSVEKIIYLLFGARQIAKSETEVSLCLRELSLFKQTEAMALFSGQPDKDTFVKKISTAITHGEKFMIVPNIDKDWSKEEIRFGFTKQDNTTELRARLYIYNTQEGKKIQVGSGKSVSFLLFDEVAKNPFKAVYDTIEPALLSDFGGLRCAPILAFTGGETEKARDARSMVENPNKTTQFTTTLEDGEEIGGRFISGLYRKDCKEEKKFSDFIGTQTNTWLDDYPIFVSNFAKAERKINEEKEEALKSPDKSTYTLKRIFFPLNLDDVFLTQSNNEFPVDACRARKYWLEKEYEPEYLELFRDAENKVQFKFSNKKPITKFPIQPPDNKEAPICVYERPEKDVPPGTYIIGIDPVNEDRSSDKVVSLASIYVYKRLYNPMGAFQNSIVASWTGRFNLLKEFHELALMISEWYNAVDGVLPENEDKTLIQYFFFKKKGHFLADSIDLAKQINQTTRSIRVKGLSASTVNQRHYMKLMVEDAKEEVEFIEDDGTPEGKITTVMGVNKINDPMLLEEMIHYKGKTVASKGVHDGNFDRIIAYGHCLTLARYYDIKYPSNWRPKPINDNVHKEPTLRTPWGHFTKGSLFVPSKQLYTRKGNSMFPR